jgi:hypothetical protein
LPFKCNLHALHLGLHYDAGFTTAELMGADAHALIPPAGQAVQVQWQFTHSSKPSFNPEPMKK